MSTAKIDDDSAGSQAVEASAISLDQADSYGDKRTGTGKKDYSGGDTTDMNSVGAISSSSDTKEFKRALSFQYKIFTSHFEYLHGVLRRLSEKYNGLNILSIADPSTAQNESALDSVGGIIDVKNRFTSAVEDWRKKANMSEAERAAHEKAQREEQKQKEKAKTKSSRRLPQVVTFFFDPFNKMCI